jgi:hypothetical protein
MRAVLGLIAGIIALATPNPSSACKCAPPPSVPDALREASAVFEGRVMQRTALDLEVEVTLNVVQAWKGVQTETIRVRTRAESAACGVEFAPNESYLVYATQRAADSSGTALEVLRCGRTRTAREAGEDYAQLGIGVVPVSPREPAAQAAPASKPRSAPSDPTANQQVEPAAGGCASCALTATPAGADAHALGWLLLGAALVTWQRARRRARRSNDGRVKLSP